MAQLPPVSGLISLLSDFGLVDSYVGQIHAAIKREHRKADILDLSHGVPPQDVRVGALFLQTAVDRFPVGSIHVAVVDPGVGTDRRLLGVLAAGCFWLGPDNGLLTPALEVADEVRVLQPQRLDIDSFGATFHGRDILAPVAGRLSSGRYSFRSIGPQIEDPQLLPVNDAETGRVLHVDHFGNLITDFGAACADVCRGLRIAGREVPLCRTYAEVAVGEPLVLLNSFGLLEVAVNQGSAQQLLGVGAGAEVELL